MPKRDFYIENLLDIALWKEFQGRLAEFAGMSVMCVDLKGRCVAGQSGMSPFCSRVCADGAAEMRCRRCHALAGFEALRLEKPFIYTCRCGVVEAAVPVSAGGRYLGALLFGQLRLPAEEQGLAPRFDDELSPLPGDCGESAAAELFGHLPVVEYRRVEAAAGFLSALADYLGCRYAAEPHMTSGEGRSAGPDSGAEGFGSISPGSPIYPAVVYVRKNLTGNISMKDMAKLCHISPSYFSRIFSRDMGESFISFVNRGKVELARTMLRDSGRSVSNIASELGFRDTSHFISLFKRFEGTTPTAYRNTQKK